MCSFLGEVQNCFHAQEEIQCIDINKRQLKAVVTNGKAEQKFIHSLLP